MLFADVVHSMDITAAVGAERLREIMSELLDRSTAVVKRYGGTLSQFTGDGIMAVFGAPITLEDHAVRACLAALGIQEEAKRLATGVQDRDGIDLRLRVGLNSGQVIAGESASWSYGSTRNRGAGRNGAADGVGRPAGRGDAERSGSRIAAAISRAQASRWAASGGRCADGGKCADSRDFDAIRLGPVRSRSRIAPCPRESRGRCHSRLAASGRLPSGWPRHKPV